MDNLTTNKLTKFDKITFWVCIVDLLFLPNVWFISIPYSLPLIFYWYIKRSKRLQKNKEFKLFFFLFLIMLAGTILGSIINIEYLYDNSVYIIMYTSMFLYYFMFHNYLNISKICIKKILIFFIIFVVVLAVVFNIDRNLYYYLFSIWNPRASTVGNQGYLQFIGNRYMFIYMDPNNIAYLMNSIMLYLFLNTDCSLFTKVLLFLSLVFVLISAMSSGGFFTLIISLCLLLIASTYGIYNSGKIVLKIKIKPYRVILFFLSILLLMLIVPKIDDFMNTSTAIESMNRYKENSMDSRINIWVRVINQVSFGEFLSLLFVGKGGLTLAGGLKVNPHNGHIYWILAYGLISYIIFMYLIFRKSKTTSLRKYIWIIPVFIGFTINILIGELKLMGVVVLLLANSRVVSSKNERST